MSRPRGRSSLLAKLTSYQYFATSKWISPFMIPIWTRLLSMPAMKILVSKISLLEHLNERIQLKIVNNRIKESKRRSSTSSSVVMTTCKAIIFSSHKKSNKTLVTQMLCNFRMVTHNKDASRHPNFPMIRTMTLQAFLFQKIKSYPSAWLWEIPNKTRYKY